MEPDFLNKVLNLYREKNWKKLLQLSAESVVETRKLLWVWPSESNLQLIANTVQECGLKGVISIGCGCGLFEWLLQEYSGLPVIGYEVNEDWWSSKYSSPQFIKLNFPKQPPTPDILVSNYALLFCYFNNGDAFKEYVRCYKGGLVFIIGPGYGAGRHTNPEPFSPNFGSDDWVLYKSGEVRNTGDFVTAYIRRN